MAAGAVSLCHVLTSQQLSKYLNERFLCVCVGLKCFFYHFSFLEKRCLFPCKDAKDIPPYDEARIIPNSFFGQGIREAMWKISVVYNMQQIIVWGKKPGKTICTMEEWVTKLTELAEMAKWTNLLREKKNFFLKAWEPHVVVLLKEENIELMIWG